jgi:hypothetical protein
METSAPRPEPTPTTSKSAWSRTRCAYADGRKELVALADGFRESSQSWADPPRDDRSGIGGRRRGAGVLEGLTGGVPRHPRAAVLVPRQLG